MNATTSAVGLESMEYNPETGTYRAEYDREVVDPSLAVVASLAAALGVRPVDLAPLNDAVDADALDAMVRGRDGADVAVSVALTVDDHAVTVAGDGTVTVEPLGGDRSGDEPGPDDAQGAARSR